MYVTPLLLALAIATPALSAPSSADHLRRTPSSGGPQTMELNRSSGRRHSADPLVRRAWMRDARLLDRSRFAHLLDDEGRARLKRDIVDAREADAKSGLRKRATADLIDWGRDLQYTTFLSIGTPAQKFDITIDTGSSDFWVFTECSNTTECGGVPLYDPQKSSSFVANNTRYQIQYGSGSATGVWGADLVSFAGYENKDQLFGLVSRSDAWYGEGTDISGLMGFAWPSIATGGTPFWAATSSTWDDKQFGVYLARETQSFNTSNNLMKNYGGSMTLGGLDSSKYTGEVSYVSIPANQQDYWRIDVEGLSVGGKTIPFHGTGRDQVTGLPLTSASALFDTGTTLIYGPPEAVNAIYNSLPGAFQVDDQGTILFPCDTIPSINLEFTFAGRQWPIQDSDIIGATWSVPELVSIGLPRSSIPSGHSMFCEPAIFPSDSKINPLPWQLGDTFLKNVYTAYRLSPPALGLAQLAPSAINNFSSSQITENNAGSPSSGANGSSGKQSGAISVASVSSVLGIAALSFVALCL